MHTSTFRLTSLAAAALLALAGCSFDFGPGEVPGQRFGTLELRDQQRAFWVDHATWSHTHAIAVMKDLEGRDAEYDRLLEGMVDYIGSFRTLYGADADRTMNRVLRQHVFLEEQLVLAVKSCDEAAIGEASARWRENADQIVAALITLNPSFDEKALQTQLNEHLDRTLALARAIQRDDWAADVAHYDALIDNGLALGDAMVEAFAAERPEQIREDVITVVVDGVEEEISLTSADIAVHLGQRELWSDHVMYTRFFLVLAIADLPGTGEIAARLLANQREIGDSVKPVFGEEAGEQLGTLLEEHIGIAVELVTAAKAGDEDAQKDASERWTANANAIARLLAGAAPGVWPEAVLAETLRMHLEITLEEAVARLEGDWQADVDAYDGVVEMIYEMADVLSTGVIQIQHGLVPEGDGGAGCAARYAHGGGCD